jgi:hypothetical protein
MNKDPYGGAAYARVKHENVELRDQLAGAVERAELAEAQLAEAVSTLRETGACLTRAASWIMDAERAEAWSHSGRSDA